MATRWNLENSGEQCSTCNCVNDGMQEQHRFYIEETYGSGTADKLELMGHGEAHFSEHELQGMIDELKKELKAIKIEKGMI